MRYIDLINKYDNSFKEYEREAVLFLIEEIENISRSELLFRMNEEIDNSILPLLIEKIELYTVKHIPVQYIVNKCYFYSNSFYVDENVLIPRFDTEVVVEKAIEEINKKYIDKSDKIKIIDVGTGSGCIAITLALNIKNAMVDAVDISSAALKVAQRNNEELKSNVKMIHNDLLRGLNFKYDVIISNPPYINDSEFVMDLVRNNEPNLALFSPDNGLYHYKEIIKESLDRLNKDGMVIFEIPDNKADLISEFASKYYEDIKIYKDYNHQRRVMVIENRRKN